MFKILHFTNKMTYNEPKVKLEVIPLGPPFFARRLKPRIHFSQSREKVKENTE